MRSHEKSSPSPSTPETGKEHEPFGVDNFDEIREQKRKILKEELGKVDAWKEDEVKAARATAQSRLEEYVGQYLIGHNSVVDKDDPELPKMMEYVRHYTDMTEDEWLYPRVEADGTVKQSARREVEQDYKDRHSSTASSDPDKDPAWPTGDPDEEPVWPKTDPDDDEPVWPKTDPDDEPTVTPPEGDPKTDPDKKDDDEEGKEGDPKPGEETKEEAPKPKTPEEIRAIVDADPAIMAARANVDRLRTELAALSAKRQGRLFNREGGKLQQEYNAKQAEYETALNNLIRLEVSAEKAAGLERSEGQERFDVALKLVDSFKKLQEQSVEMLKNTKLGKFVTWMTEGGTFKRILKGVAVGAAVGAIGAAITAFTAGTGAGAVGAGLATAGALAGRFARGFAASDARGGRGMESIDGSAYMTQLVDHMGETEGDSKIDSAHRILMEKLEADTKKEQGKRRKSTYIAMGSVALGSVLAYGVNEVVDSYTGHNKGAHDLLWNDEVQGKAVPDKNAIPEMRTVIPERVFDPNALRIDDGEGWYQTFQDLGVPQKDWPALLNKVGPELQGIKVNGMDLAYRMPNNEWGIRMTPDHTMPKEALTAIMNAHDQMTGISTAPAAIEVPVETPAAAVNTPNIPAPTPEAPVGVPNLETVSPADRGSVESIIMKEVISPSDIANTPAFDKITTIASWYDPEWIGQKLELPAADWNRLEEYIIGQVQTADNSLYKEVFNVDQRGYLHFNNIREIPDTTMADMINQAKRLSSTL